MGLTIPGARFDRFSTAWGFRSCEDAIVDRLGGLPAEALAKAKTPKS